MYRNLNCDLVGITGRQSEIIELALTFGFRGIDIDINDLVKRCERSSLESAARFLISSKLKIGSFQVPVDMDTDEQSFEEALKSLKKAAEIAGRVEAKVGIVEIPTQTDRLPYPEYFEVIRKRVEQIAALFGEEDVKIALAMQSATAEDKQFKFIQDVEGFVALANTCKSAGIVLDLWTWFCGKGNVEDLAKIGVERVYAVRLADCKEGVAPEAATESDCMLPGTVGTIDPIPYVQQLAAAELDVPVSAGGSFSNTGGKRDEFIEKIQDRLHDILTNAGLPSQLRKPAEIAEAAYPSNSPA
ncbi:MAG: sugar phosphate isomerase/epimerase [Planctomycetota bacterium]|nr:sugar phosphate isomerase/epimerase [Planctomycetota bacterium]